MVRLSTTYEKVFDELEGKEISEKFFVVRGDESYARTTACVLSTSNYNESVIDYYTVDVSVNVHRGIGSSPIHLYVDDALSPVKTWNATSNVSQFTLTGLKLPYGYDHKIYAVYEGNAQCLKSKSKVVELDYDIPSQFATNFDINCSSSISTGATLSYSVALKIGTSSTSSALHNRSILVYVDGLYYDTITTGSNTNTASGTVTGLENGVHKIAFEVVKASSINQGSAEVSVNVGHHVDIIEYPTMFIQNQSNTVKVKVTNYLDEPTVGATVSLMSSTATTNSEGIATFTFTTVTNGSYSATCNGTSSEPITVSDSNKYSKIRVSDITTSVGDGIVAYGGNQTISFNINQNVPNIPIILTGGIEGTFYTNEYGKAEAIYNGQGVGTAKITYDMPSEYKYSEMITFFNWLYITDCLCQWKANEGYTGINYDVIDPIKEYNSYFEFPVSTTNNSLYVHDVNNNHKFDMTTKITVASACSNIVMTYVTNGYKLVSEPFSVNNGDVIYVYQDFNKFPWDGPLSQFTRPTSKASWESGASTTEDNSISFRHTDGTQVPLKFKEMTISVHTRSDIL